LRDFVVRRHRTDGSRQEVRQTILRVDTQGLITRADGRCEGLLGYRPDELMGKPFGSVLATRQDDPLSPANRPLLDSGAPALVTVRHRDGHFFTADVSLRVDANDDDQSGQRAIALWTDNTVHPRLLKLAESATSAGLWQVDVQTMETQWSPGLYRILELQTGAMITTEQALFYCQQHANRVRALFRRSLRSGRAFRIDLDLLTSRQQLKRVRLHGCPLRQGERISAVGGILVDLSEQQRHSDNSNQQLALLQAVTQATDDLILALSPTGDVIGVNTVFNRQFFRMFGKELEEGTNILSALEDYPDDLRTLRSLFQRALERDEFMVEMPLAQRQEEQPIYEMRFRRVLDRFGEPSGSVLVARDISQRARRAASADFRNRHDATTGLLNRRAFAEWLNRLLESPERRKVSHALLILDLDHFAQWQEQVNAAVCDRLLRELAETLSSRVRQRDRLARLTGDTFVLLLENCPEEHARQVAENLLQTVREFRFHWKDQQLKTTASGGLVLIPTDLEISADASLAQASDLCHSAKLAGHDQIHCSADYRSLELDQQIPLDHLRQCMEEEQFLLNYQILRPIGSHAWGDHIEILARLPALDGGEPILPDSFLPLAERFDLACELDRQVVRSTLMWLLTQPLLEPRLKLCSFNLSMASLLDPTFPGFVEEVLAGVPQEPECFCFEVRLSDAAQYPEETKTLCERMHRIGCRVALDGVGVTGESQDLVSRLPVDIIKLEPGLARSLRSDDVQKIMAQALQRVAEISGKLTVATAIEGEETLRTVRELGFHFGQGYRIATPKPLDSLSPENFADQFGNL